MIKRIVAITLVILLISGFFYRNTVIRLYQGYIETAQSKQRAEYFLIDNNQSIKDITKKLIADKSIPGDLKKPLINGERRIVVFKYLSNGNVVAGYMSYLTHGDHPAIIFLRGGNGFYGIMRPNNKFSFLKGFNVIGTLYRGNIYGGIDEFGGKDIQDVENLFKYLPELQRFSHIQIQPPYTMMGVSRGAMEMFIALSRSSYIKNLVDRAISVSGNVDLSVSMKNRPEMDYLFKSEFKKSSFTFFDEWIKSRNPVDNVANLSKNLRVLLVYGLADNRVSLREQKNLINALKKNKITSHLVVIPNANHGMDDHFEELNNILTKDK